MHFAMKKLYAGFALILLCGMLGATAHAQSAGAWDKKGASAEARDDWDGAFEAYRQAHLKKPFDLRYKTHYERMRFQAANAHVDRGRVLRQSGDQDGAITEFSRALQIDPGNQAASQELEQTTKPKAPPGAATTGPGGAGGGVALTPMGNEQTPYQVQVQKDILSLGGPVTLQPVNNDPISLRMSEDSKVIYQAIGKAAGLNVIFDPEYTSKRIPVELNNVSLGDALRIVGTLSGTFWKPVTSNTLFVAQNNQTKRHEMEDLATQTFYLTNVSQQNDANEILVALRNLLDASVKVFLVASQNAIVLRATPDELLLAEKLINDLDRTRPEVVIDVAVLEVSRDKIRNLGITLPTSFGMTPQLPTTSATTGTTTTTGTTAGTTGTGLTLNNIANINATDFAVTVTGGTVNALLSDSDTRILQNPRIRATDGQRAQLKIGSKIPVATGSYNAGVSTGIASVGVQTQFTYLDVGVNIDITPSVHYDREISMKMHIEVSSQNGNVTISNVTEPIIAQKVADQTIQVKDGEPSLLAGILTKQDSKNVNGTPGLGEIPFLKYFFSSQNKEQQSDEIVFLVIPHIVREAVLTDVNTRAFYTGTSNSIELMRKTPDQNKAMAPVAGTSVPAVAIQPTTAANAASSMITKIAADGQAIAPPGIGNPAEAAANAAVTSVAGAPVQLNLVPAMNNQPVGSTFQVAVMLSNANDLYSVPLQIQFNSKVLNLVNVDAGNLLSQDGQAVALVHRDEGDGAVTISASRPPGVTGVNGSGTVCTLTFKAVGPGDSALQMVRIGAKDSRQNSLPAVGTPATVHVQ